MSTEIPASSPDDVTAAIADILLQARVARHRAVLVLSGTHEWCLHAATRLIEGCAEAIWIGNSLSGGIPAGKARQVLGSEYALAVVDAHDGLHPDALAAVCGTVVAGGALILLTPDWQQWPALADPDYVRLASYPHDWQALPQHFVAHIQQTLDVAVQASGGLHVHQLDHPLTILPANFALQWPRLSNISDNCMPSLDQQQCLQRLAGHKGVSVLLAGRGHGKSALLGFAAKQWLERGLRVLLVAPSRSAAGAVFRHAEDKLAFSAPDMLLQDESIAADILLVDEAAAIPQPLLLEMLQRFPHAVLATTTDGYEGSGQGFVLRFLRELDQCHPGWQRLALDAPVRWAAADPLERWLYQALLLDAEEPAIQHGMEVSAAIFERVEQATLAENLLLLKDFYGLLRSAHYRTTPDDLRFLLDAPMLSLYRLVCHAQTIAVAVVVEEGSIDPAMAEEIVAGRRRPRGHLLVQTLAVHCHQPQFLQQRVARVVRIAVHTQYQQRGLGSQLLQQIERDQNKQGVKIVGSSFSAAPDVLTFWKRNEFELLRVGHKRQAASAAPSALVLKIKN